MTRHVLSARKMLLVAFAIVMGTGLLVGPKGSNAESPSAPSSQQLSFTGGLYTPSGLSGYADLHVHQFTNLALGGKWLNGRAWPDGTNGFSLPSTRAQMQTAIPRCSGNVPLASGSGHGGLDLGKAAAFFGVGAFAGFAVNEFWGADTGLHTGRRHGVCQLETVLGFGFCRGQGGSNAGCNVLPQSQCTTGVQSPCIMDSWANLCRDKENDDFSVGGVCNLIGVGNCENTCSKGNLFCRGNTACSTISRSNCPSSNVCTWRPAGNLCKDRSGDGIDAGLACNANGGNNTDCARPCYWDPNVGIGHVEDPAHDFTDRRTGNDIDHASWPSWDAVAHQQVYVDWLKEAYDGGLRLMIMSALNNETLCKLLPNGTPCDDLTSVSAQIAEAKAMDNVGAYSFYEIVYTAAQARATIAAGRMAVILSVESSDIFNGDDPINTLVDLYNNGVRTLQPMHQFNGKLGGVAFHDEVIAAMQTIKNIGQGNFNNLCKTNGGNGTYAPCNAKIGNVNYKGLTETGKNFIRKMMQLGMPIDISHMSEKTIADVQTLTAGTCNYPVYISHGHVRDLLERGSDFPPGTEYGWKARNSHEKTVPDWVLSYLSNSGGLLGLRTGADYYDFPKYQQLLSLAGLGNAPIPVKGSLQMNGSPKKLGGTEYHFAYAVDYLTRVKNVNVALGSDLNGLIEQMLFDNESLTKCPGTSGVDTQDCKMAGLAHIGKEYALMNQKLNTTGLQNVSSYNSLRNNSADAYVQMWERSTSIGSGNCCNPITVSQLDTTTAYNGTTTWITINGTGFNALPTMSAKLRAYQGTAEYACTGFQMISSTQAACLAPSGLPVGFYDVIVSNHSAYCNQSGVLAKAILMTNACVAPPSGLVDWWTFDETSGTSAQDIRGLTNDVGTHMNGPTPVPGIVGGALSFDGDDDFVEVANSPEVNFFGACTLMSDPPPNAEPLTIDLWIKTNLPAAQLGPNSGLMTILDKRVTAGGNGYSLFLFNGRLGFQINGTNFVAPASGLQYVNVADNLWHFITVSLRRCASEGGQLYVDGKPVISTPGTNGFINTSKLFIGQRNPVFGQNFFKGALDELEIFKRALSDDEVRTLFEARNGGKCFRQHCPTITINPLVHTTWPAGVDYPTLQLTVTGGTGPYTFQTPFRGFNFDPNPNFIPLGMSLDSDGTLSGKPLFPGTYTFSVTVEDANACLSARQFQIIVSQDCSPFDVATAAALPSAAVNVPYLLNFTTTGHCLSPLSWTVTRGALPSGLTLATNGVLSGMAQQAGDFAFTVTAANSFFSTSKNHTLKVQSANNIVRTKTLVISAFRENGPNGPRDEFIEIFNPSNLPVTINSLSRDPNGPEMGIGVFSSTGNGTGSDEVILRCKIPGATVIKARGWYLCGGSQYSLSNLGGNGGTFHSVPDATIIGDIPNDAGLALLDIGSSNITVITCPPSLLTHCRTGFDIPGGNARVFDKVGFRPYHPSSPAPNTYPSMASNYCEGTCLQPVGDASTLTLASLVCPPFGVGPSNLLMDQILAVGPPGPPASPPPFPVQPGGFIGGVPVCYGESGQYQIGRRRSGQQFDSHAGNLPRDTDNNADDFILDAPNPSTGNVGQGITGVSGVSSVLGAAGPHSRSAPPMIGSVIHAQDAFDVCVGAIKPCGPGALMPRNAERRYDRDPAIANVQNDPFGTFILRRRFVNFIGSTTGARYRIDDLSTLCGGQIGINGTISAIATQEARNLRGTNPTCQGEGSELGVFTAVFKAVNHGQEIMIDSAGVARTALGTVLEDTSTGGAGIPAVSSHQPFGGGNHSSFVATNLAIPTGDGVNGGNGSFRIITGTQGSVFRIAFKFGVVKSGRFKLLLGTEVDSSQPPAP